jgi:hypothetical protein
MTRPGISWKRLKHLKLIFYSWLQKVPVFQLVGSIEPA